MRRLFIGIVNAVVLLAFAQASSAQQAQGPGGYPDRPVRVIVPVAAAGGTDIIARIVLIKLADVLGRPFVVDNRPGAGGILGNEIVANARPDGYTPLFTREWRPVHISVAFR